MQATINVSRVPAFRPRLSAGSVYSVSGFDVARCAQNYRLTDSSLLIRFNDVTVLDEVIDPESPLPSEGFRFRNALELLGLANSNTHLPGACDVLGEITSVKSTVSDPPEIKNRVMVSLKLDSGVDATLSTFDSQAVSFHQRLDAMHVDPKVVVVTNVNPKLIGGRLFLNATSGSHLYFDKDTVAGEACFYRLVARDTGLPSAAPLLKRYAKVEPLTIDDLNKFVVTAPSQEIDFLCTGRVSRIAVDKGWCYVSCSKCAKKLQRTATSLTCVRCDSTHAVGSLRYRVEMAIADDTAEGFFVCFDGVMARLHGLTASEAGEMVAGDGVNAEDSQMPPFITSMEGQTYTFQVRVTAYNFTAAHQTYTITRIIDGRGPAPAPDFVDNGGNDDDGGDRHGEKPVTAVVEGGHSSCDASVCGGEGTVGVVTRKMSQSAPGVGRRARMA